jgi:hypothetical protein
MTQEWGGADGGNSLSIVTQERLLRLAKLLFQRTLLAYMDEYDDKAVDSGPKV